MPRFDVGRLEFSRQTPLEARYEPVFQIGDFARWPVAGKHDLFVPVEEHVERVEKFLLTALLASQELDVVNQAARRRAGTFCGISPASNAGSRR